MEQFKAAGSRYLDLFFLIDVEKIHALESFNAQLVVLQNWNVFQRIFV